MLWDSSMGASGTMCPLEGVLAVVAETCVQVDLSLITVTNDLRSTDHGCDKRLVDVWVIGNA